MRLALGGAAVALFTWWAVHDGGTAPGSWYPGALLFLAALVAVAYARRPAPPLAAGASWRSPRWRPSPSGASSRSPGRTPAATPGTAPTARCCTCRLRAVRSAAVDGGRGLDPPRRLRAGHGAGGRLGRRRDLGGDDGSFPVGRLAGPIGYENASAALFLAAFWPAVLLASQRARHRHPLRGFLLAAAGCCSGSACCAQSRGSLIAGPSALVLALALVRERRRLCSRPVRGRRDDAPRIAAPARGLCRSAEPRSRRAGPGRDRAGAVDRAACGAALRRRASTRAPPARGR